MSDDLLSIPRVKLSASEQSDFFFNVSSGRLPGYSFINKFGENPLIDSADAPVCVWDFGGVYNYTADAGAVYYMSSDNALDTQLLSISVLTVDSNDNWNDETFTQQLAGQVQTQLNPPSGDPIVRIYRIENESDAGEDIAGKLYVYEDSTVTLGVPLTPDVRGHINDGNNQTLMAQYTIPTGKVGFLYQLLAGQSRPQTLGTSVLSLKTRRYGKVFKVKGRVSTVNSGSTNYDNALTFPAPIPSRTDIDAVVESVSSNGTGIYAIYDLMLVDEDKFTPGYLNAIGQVQRVP